MDYGRGTYYGASLEKHSTGVFRAKVEKIFWPCTAYFSRINLNWWLSWAQDCLAR